jgi:hypothetical protein
VRRERRHEVTEEALRGVEHPVVVERPAAAERLLRHHDAEARRLEDLDRGLRRLSHDTLCEDLAGDYDHILMTR